MKIPETSANAGVYYNEDNRPWQNGMVMEAAHVVGGAGGDAGFVHPHVYTQPQRPPLMPNPGYVVPGAAYYGGYGAVPAPPAVVPDDFADYMWMENEEEFDKQVMQQLEEEALMEQCIEAMLEDERATERERGVRPVSNGHTSASNGPSSVSEEQVSKSTLNPLAAEFVPTRPAAPASASAPSAPATAAVAVAPAAPAAPHVTQEKPAPVEVSVNDVVTTPEPSVTAPTPASAAPVPSAAAAAPTQDDNIQVATVDSENAADAKESSEAKKPDASKTASKAKPESKKGDEPKPTKGAARTEPKTAKPEKPAKVEPKPKEVKKEVKVSKGKSEEQAKVSKSKSEPEQAKVSKSKSEPEQAKVTKSKSEPEQAKVTKSEPEQAKVTKSEPEQAKAKVSKSEPEPAKVSKSKSDSKVAPKGKKEVRGVRSEGRVEEAREAEVAAPAAEQPKSQPSLAPEPSVAAAAPAFKPINYAAAARANKPKPASPPAALAK